MKVLLLRPHPGNERFGLAPFFRVEPLGLEYIAAALRARGHAPVVADLRFAPGAAAWVRRARPQVVGISCPHSLEYDRARETAREVRRAAPEAFVANARDTRLAGTPDAAGRLADLVMKVGKIAAP